VVAVTLPETPGPCGACHASGSGKHLVTRTDRGASSRQLLVKVVADASSGGQDPSSRQLLVKVVADASSGGQVPSSVQGLVKGTENLPHAVHASPPGKQLAVTEQLSAGC
jgi:hypothetical protein